MVSICPAESDPRPNVSKFVSDSSETVLAGLIAEGVYVLMDVVQEEVRKQFPDARSYAFSKEYFVDHHVMTCSDLKEYVKTLDWNGVRFIFLLDDICVVNWQAAFTFLAGKGVTLFSSGYACRGVPICVKRENAFD